MGSSFLVLLTTVSTWDERQFFHHGWCRRMIYRKLGLLSFIHSASKLHIIAGTFFNPLSRFLLLNRPGHLPFIACLVYSSTANNLVFVAAFLTIMSCISLCLLWTLIVIKARVFNSKDPLNFMARKVPGFRHQNPSSDALIRFRENINDLLTVDYPDSLSKAVAIRHWVRAQQPQDKAAWVTENAIDHEDPHRLLREQRAGMPSACRRFSYILLGALLSAGFDARFLFFASRLFRRGVRFHAVVEVWIEELGQWILLDPTYDCLISIDGKVASSIELCNAVESGDLSRIEFVRNGSDLKPIPQIRFFQECCRHLFLALSNAVFDGYAVRMTGSKRIDFLHYNSKETYPEFEKRVLLALAMASLVLSLVLDIVICAFYH